MSTTPPTPSAEQIQQLPLQWAAELLEEPEVLPEDNFLELGGHSMLALQMAERAKERFGAEYDLVLLFEKDFAATAAELAHRIAEH